MHRYDARRRLLAYAIAALAGFVDATGYLAADRYFVSFMSGNTTRLGVDLATGAASAFVPALLIAGFVTAVVAGALVADLAGERRKTAVVGLAALLLCGAAASRMLAGSAAFLACSVLAMGVLNNAFRRDGEVAVGLTYMTGALVRFGQGLASRLRGVSRPGWTANALLWAALASGAVSGGLAASRDPLIASWIAAFAALSLAGISLAIEQRGTGQSS